MMFIRAEKPAADGVEDVAMLNVRLKRAAGRAAHMEVWLTRALRIINGMLSHGGRCYRSEGCTCASHEADRFLAEMVTSGMVRFGAGDEE